MGSAKYDIETLVVDVREIVRTLGYTNCVLVSHDWGGVVAWQFVQRYPQMVTRFITMAMPHPKSWVKNFNLAQFAASWYIFFFQLPWLPELFTTRRNHHMTRRGVFTGRAMGCKREGAVQSSDIDVYLWSASPPGVTTRFINYYRNVFTRNVMYGIVNPVPNTPLQVPVLSIIPDCDNAILKSTYRGQAKYASEMTELRLTSEFCSSLDALCCGTRLCFADSWHWVMLDAPREVVAAMCDFLDVEPAKRPTLESVSPVTAEPCTRAMFRNGELEFGSTDTPLSLADLAGSQTKRHTDM